MASLVLTVIGDDRPGLVDALSGVIADHGGNWEQSRMAHLANKFAGILLVQIADARAEALVEALNQLQTDDLLHITAEASTAESAGGGYRILQLELVGQDHPGIVHDIAHTLAQRDISIEELSSETRSASMAGGELFHASARLRVPELLTRVDLQGILEALADELMVDVELDEIEHPGHA
jgi:glycine cleavage system regulatory protein